VRSCIRTIIEQLLKREHAPVQEPRGGGYDAAIARPSDVLESPPPASVDGRLALPELYEMARQNAAISLR
jgi:hypothetical protein